MLPLRRNAETSILYYLRDELADDGWLVSGTFLGIAELKTAHPTDEDIARIVTRETATGEENEIVLPVIALAENNFIRTPLQIGGGESEGNIQYVITIFAEDEPQKETLSNQIYDYLFEQMIDLNDYSAGFPPVAPSGYGVIEFQRINSASLRIPESPNVADKHRELIVFNAAVIESP